MAAEATGFDGVLMVGAPNVADPTSATLVAVPSARDINVTINVDKTEVSDRGSKFKRYCPSMIEVEVSATLTYNANSKVFIDDLIAKNTMGIAVLHSVGGTGLYFTGQCFSSDFAQPLTDGMTISITLCPVYDNGAVSTSYPQFT